MIEYPHYRNPNFPNMVYVTDYTWQELMARIEQLESREVGWGNDLDLRAEAEEHSREEEC